MKNIKLVVLFLTLSISLNSKVPISIKNSNGLVPVALSDSFIFGVMGHPFTQLPYKTISINKQIEIIKNHNISFYRIDLNENVTIIDSLIIRQFLDSNINVLPVNNDIPNFNIGIAENFILGQRIGDSIYKKVGKLEYYEVGNELDIACLKSDQLDGNNISDYDILKMDLTASFLKGIITSLKNKNSKCKIIINCSGWLHYTFFDLLVSRNVTFDIVGYHWYSDMGLMSKPTNRNTNVLNELSKIGKDIWITEVNYKVVANNPNDYSQSRWVSDFINDLNNYKGVKSLFYFQLLDADPIGEEYFGLVKKTYENKLISDLIKYKVEEIKFGYKDFVSFLFLKILDREADQNGLLYFSNSYNQTKNQFNLIQNILYSDESYSNFISKQYLLFFNRIPNNSELSYWNNYLKNNSRENLINEFCMTNEFWMVSGQNNSGFINQLYLKLLNRSPDNNFWLNCLNNNCITKKDLINLFIHTDEYYTLFINNLYYKILGRMPFNVEGNYWLTQMKNGSLQNTVIINFLLSEESFKNSIILGFNKRNTAGFYFKNDLLGL